MVYQPDMLNHGHGTIPPYSPKSARQKGDSNIQHLGYSPFYNAPPYQAPSNPAAYQSNNYIQAPHTPSNGLHAQQHSAAQFQESLPPRPSGVAVVIPTPAKSLGQSQRINSLPITPNQSFRQDHKTVSRSANPARFVPPAASLDYKLLFLSLAEEYLTAAYRQGSLVALMKKEDDLQQYYKLVAAGLGCLKTVLKNFKLQPQVEAIVRLQYAAVLHDETENTMEAEETLSDGINLCDRYRLLDLKYNMQHLLARVLFKASSRASSKFLDGVIKDVEAYQHAPWAYAFRFLRVSLALEVSSHQDIVAALSQLRSISTLAETHGDKAVLMIAAGLEALLHLRASNSAESIEQAQRAIAVARSSQFDPRAGGVPQLTVLANFADTCCSLARYDPTQATTKLQALQASLERDNNAWKLDGSFVVPVSSPKNLRVPSGNGIIRGNADGHLSMLFVWRPREDVSALGFLLSSMILAHQNTSDGQKSEQMLKEGIRSLDKNTQKMSSTPQSISTAASIWTWRHLLKSFFRLHLTFLLCNRTSWAEAWDQFRELQKLTFSATTAPEPLTLLTQYLEAILHQGTGSTSTALSIYQLPQFSLNKTANNTPPTNLDLAILSTLNSILIIQSPSHPSNNLLPTLLSSLELHLPRITSSKWLLSAYNIVLATTPLTAPTIIKTKQYLQSSLHAAKTSSNNQLLCITLNFMSFRFFRGVVGDQAEKSAKASQNLAVKCMDGLWKSVSAGVLADTLEVAGKSKDAEMMRGVGKGIVAGLPERVRRWEEDEGEDVKMEVQ